MTELFVHFDVKIHRWLNSKEKGYEGSKPDPSYWSDLLEEDPDFAAEFNNPAIPEADATTDGFAEHFTYPDSEFTPECLQDTYLDMEVALPRDNEGPEFVRITKRLRDANGIPIGTA